MSKINLLNKRLLLLLKNKAHIVILLLLAVFFATSLYFYKVNILDKKNESNNKSLTLKSDTFALMQPSALPNTSFDVQYSPMINPSVPPTSPTNPQLTQNYSIVLENTKLGFFNYQTKTITPIDENIDRAKFIDATRILYLKVNSGIYIYNISDNTNKLVINSLDPQTLDNIVFVDSMNFFFISTQTGKTGFGKIEDKNLRVIDQKMIESTSSYVKTSAYRLPQISPDKKLIAFYDMTSNSDNTVKIIVLPINAAKISDKIFEVSVETPTGYFGAEQALEWSNSSKFLRAGKNSIIEIDTKKVIYKAENNFILNYFSLDEKSIIEINKENGESKILDLITNESLPFPSNISQVFWIDDNKALLLILQKVYLFDLQKNTLEKIIETEGNYKILSANLISTQSQIIELTKK